MRRRELHKMRQSDRRAVEVASSFPARKANCGGYRPFRSPPKPEREHRPF